MSAWVRSGGKTNLVAELLSPITSRINGLLQRIRNAANRVVQLVLGLARRVAAAITAAIAAIAGFVTRTITAVSNLLRRALAGVQRMLQAVISRVMSVARGLPSAVAGLVSRILSGVGSLVNRVISAVTRAINAVTRVLVAFVRRVAAAATALVRRILALVIAAVHRVVAMVKAFLRRAASLVARAIRAVVSFITGLVRRAAKAIADAVMWLVLKWLKPRIQAALRRAREIIERIRRYGERYVRAAREGVRRAQALGRSILQSLLKPEGDHFTIGITGGVGVSGGEVVIGGAALSAQFLLDMHVSYRHNSMRAYITVNAELGGGVGVGLEATGVSPDFGLGGTYGWGSVLSYGQKSDMDDSVTGWQVGAGVGAEVQGAVGPAGVSVGMSEGLSTNLEDVPAWAARAPFGYNPVTGFAPPPPGVPVIGGPGFPDTVPGTATPAPPGGGTWSEVGPAGPGGAGPGGAGPGRGGPPLRPTVVPESPQTVRRSVFFDPIGSDEVVRAGQLAKLQQLADRAEALASGAPRALANGLIVGHASPRWRHPRARHTPAEENQELSTRRALNTKARLEPLVRGRSLPFAGISTQAVGATTGAEPDQDRPDQRRADVSVNVTRFREVPPPPPPPPPPRPDPHAPTPPPGQLPSLGWDTSVSAQWTGKAGAGVEATAGPSASIGYTFGRGPKNEAIWREDFGAATGKGLRILLGLYKVFLGMAHGNSIAMVRDAAGLVGGVEDIIGVELTDPIVDFVIPAPSAP